MRRLNLSSSTLALAVVGVALLLGVGWPPLAALKRGSDPAGVVNHVALDTETIDARRKILDLRIRYYREIDGALKDWLERKKTFRACCDHLLFLSLTQYPEFLDGLDEQPGRTACAKIAHYLAWLADENADVYFADSSGPEQQVRLRNDLAELIHEGSPMRPASPMSIGALEAAAPPPSQVRPQARSALGAWLAS